MIKERAMELVAALRSGKYKQGKNYLRADDTYCCLGVAVDLVRGYRRALYVERQSDVRRAGAARGHVAEGRTERARHLGHPAAPASSVPTSRPATDRRN